MLGPRGDVPALGILIVGVLFVISVLPYVTLVAVVLEGGCRLGWFLFWSLFWFWLWFMVVVAVVAMCSLPLHLSLW